MSKYRHALPQNSGRIFLSDGGIETTLIFHEGIELPGFAAFVLLSNPQGESILRKYFSTYARLAQKYGVGIVLESPTWRANADWSRKLGYSETALAALHRQAIRLLDGIRNEFERETTPIVISGCIGPRGDGYQPDYRMSVTEARAYHWPQIKTFEETEADLVSAFTINYPEEAVGITQAAQSVGMPVVIAFTVETDGKLPTGQSLREAIQQVDETTAQGPIYFMINCAHPNHFKHALVPGEAWVKRIRGIKANASTKSHAELNESSELDAGNPTDFGVQYQELLEKLNHLSVLGGCCGTDHRHIEEVCKRCL